MFTIHAHDDFKMPDNLDNLALTNPNKSTQMNSPGDSATSTSFAGLFDPNTNAQLRSTDHWIPPTGQTATEPRSDSSMITANSTEFTGMD